MAPIYSCHEHRTSVVCRPDPPSDTYHDAPTIVIEVVSESTRRIDEDENREAYLSMDSLCVYILIESSSAAALVYRRGDSGFERETHAGLDAVISLPEVGCERRLVELHENVEFPPPGADEESADSSGEAPT